MSGSQAGSVTESVCEDQLTGVTRSRSAVFSDGREFLAKKGTVRCGDMKLLLISVLIVAAQAASLGREECRGAPSDWCGSLQTATACHAFSHCLNTVWKPLIVQVQPTKLCRYSQKLVNTVRDVLPMDKGYGETSHLIASVCSVIREDAMRKECKEMVTGFFPQISKLMESGAEPATVATLMGLCKPYDGNESSYKIGQKKQGQKKMLRLTPAKPWPENDVEELSPQDKEEGGTKECALCELTVDTVDRLLSENKTEAAIEDALGKICRRLSSAYVDKCLSFLDKYLPGVMQLLIQELDPHRVCLTLKFCKSSAAVDVGVLTTPAGSGCTVCELVAGELEQLITSNKSEMAIEEALDRFCSILPSSLSAECKSLVSIYTPAILNLLMQEIPPHEVCEKLGLCSSFHTAGPSLRSAAAERGEREQVEKQAFGEDVECELCELVVDTVDQLLSENKSEAEIQQALDDICHELPSAITTQCLSFVNEYAGVMIQLLIQELDPHQVCLTLKLCKSSAETNREAEVTEKNQANPVECELCKGIITEINSLLTNNRSEQAIIHAVEKVCDIVQGDLRLQCKSEVENYGPAVLDLLQHMDDPTQVCTYLHVCASTLHTDSRPHNQQHLLGSEECTRGPSFWCASLENARKCGMEQECVEKYGMTP